MRITLPKIQTCILLKVKKPRISERITQMPNEQKPTARTQWAFVCHTN